MHKIGVNGECMENVVQKILCKEWSMQCGGVCMVVVVGLMGEKCKFCECSLEGTVVGGK